VKKQAPPPPRRLCVGTQTKALEPFASTSKVYEKTKVSFGEISDADDNDGFVEEDA